MSITPFGNPVVPLEYPRALRRSEDEDLLDRALRGRFLAFVQEGGPRDENARTGVGELLGRLVGGVERIDRRAGAAERRHRVEADGVLGNVRAVDREHVATPESEAGEARRGAANAVGQLSVRQNAPARPIDERGLVM